MVKNKLYAGEGSYRLLPVFNEDTYCDTNDEGNAFVSAIEAFHAPYVSDRTKRRAYRSYEPRFTRTFTAVLLGRR